MRLRKFSYAKCQHRVDSAVVGSDIPENASSVRIVDELGDLHLLFAENSEGLGGAAILFLEQLVEIGNVAIADGIGTLRCWRCPFPQAGGPLP